MNAPPQLPYVPETAPFTLEQRAWLNGFLAGMFCDKFPEAARAIADAGMELGNHSYSHPHFTKLSDEEIKSQMERAEEAILKACGRGAKPPAA